MLEEDYKVSVMNVTREKLRHAKYIKAGILKDLERYDNELCIESNSRHAELAISILDRELEDISSDIIHLQETLKGYEMLKKRSNQSKTSPTTDRKSARAEYKR